MIDRENRVIRYLRLSITDRCNLRCRYCMPEEGVPPLAHEDILTFEEYLRLIRLLLPLGIDSIRVTGGEPTVRRGWLDFLGEVRTLPGIRRLALTTNGVGFGRYAQAAKDLGLDAVNLSIDTLDPEDYAHYTRFGRVQDVLEAIDASYEAGLTVKLNAVPVSGMKPEGLLRLANLARERDICVRFIELMPVGFGKDLVPMDLDALKSSLEAEFGPLLPDPIRHGDGPAVYWKPEGFAGSIGFIAAVSHAFCDGCNRIRITADGRLKLCLNHVTGLDLRALLREGADDACLTAAILEAISHTPEKQDFFAPVSDLENRSMNAIGG